MKLASNRSMSNPTAGRWLAFVLCTVLSGCDFFAFPEPSDPVTQSDGGALHQDATETSEPATDTDDSLGNPDATDSDVPSSDDPSDSDSLSGSNGDEPSSDTQSETLDPETTDDASGSDATLETVVESDPQSSSESLGDASTPTTDSTVSDETANDSGGVAPDAPLIPYLVAYSEFHDSASGEEDNAASSPDVVLSKPPETEEGDFMLIFLGGDHSLRDMGASDLLELGWILIDQHTETGADGQFTYLLYRFAEADEPETFTFVNVNDNLFGIQGLLSVYRGVNPFEPINDYAVLEDDPVHAAEIPGIIQSPTPEVITTVPNCLAIAGLSPDTATDAPVITTWPEGFTENQISVKNPERPHPNGWANIYAAERPVPAAGTVPSSEFAWDRQIEYDTYYGWLTFVLALAPLEHAE